MSMKSVGRAVLLGGLVSGALAACAEGQQIGAGGGGVGGSTTTTGTGGAADAGPTPGKIGSACKSNAECDQGTCVPIGNASYCTQTCPPECPAGTYCSIVNGTALCVPDLDQQCTKCAATTDCKLPSDMCLVAPLGDRFCARDCTVDGLCPNGFTCVDKGGYTPDGGSDAGAGDGGPTPTTPFKWCVPNSGASCPCNDKRDGVTHACTVTNASGVCGGTESCDGQQGQWKGCTAATPVAETCNAKDDNCDGKIDEGDPNALCAAEGAPPPHASWACKTGTCSLGACDPGWTSFPAGPVANGCSCAVEAGEPNGSCAAATSAGSVTETGAPIIIQGTLSSPADVDFWSIDTVDANEATTNSYHVAIAFTAPATNDEFVMDVMRGDPCTNTPTGPSTAITAYDWCVNGSNGGTVGEATCGPTAAVHCGNHSDKYYVRVYRKPGTTATCAGYTLTVSGGGGACDVTKQCP